MERLILSIDCGTQSLRALLFNKQGELQALEKIMFEQAYFSKFTSWAEQDAQVYYDTLCTAVNKLRKNNEELFSRIAAVTVTTQRDSVVFLDSNGNPLRPCILWLDHREADIHLNDIFNKAIASAIPNSSAKHTVEHALRRSRAQWVRKNEPEIWEKTDKVVLLSCYLNYKLTGKLNDSTASQIGYIPFDAKSNSWHKSGSAVHYRLFGVSKSQMPELIEPGSVLGNITAAASEETCIPQGLPVIAAASDKGCETLGNGCLSEDIASVSFGTTATVEITTDKYIELRRFVAPFPSAIKGFYNPESRFSEDIG